VGTKTSKEKWDREYTAGKWRFLGKPEEQTRLQIVAGMVHDYATVGPIGAVMDLGAGEGRLCNWLDQDKIGEYIAVDISDVALSNIEPGKIPVTRICSSLGDFVPSAILVKQPVVIVASEVLGYDDDSVEQLRRIAAYFETAPTIIVSVVGPHADKPNWTAASKKIWSDIEAQNWDTAREETVRDEQTGIMWDIKCYAFVPRRAGT